MKRLLVAAVAAAPLCLAASAAFGQTEITTNTTTPLQTSTTGDLVIAAGAGVTVRTGGPAVTINSDDGLINDGTISVRDSATGGTAILVLTGTGHTGGISVRGAVAGDDTVAERDTDKDGDLDTPFAPEGMVRYGIRITGAGAFTGDVVTLSTSVVSIEGEAGSAAISVESPMVGTILTEGGIGAKGDNSYGIRTTAAVTGNIGVFGAIQAQGENASAISIEAPLTGGLIVQGDVTNSGFRYLKRADAPKGVENLDADDLSLGGPAIRIAASASRGFVLDSPPPITDPTDADGNGFPDDTDQDDDGVLDSLERTGQVNSYGSAPALLVGHETNAIVLGNAGTGRNNYGIAINGIMASTGTYDGISSVGLQVGGLGGAVDTSNGVGVNGQVVTTAFQADSTALLIGSGAKVPKLEVVGGNVSSGVNTVEGIVATSHGIEIEAGAQVGVINNSGVIKAGVNGPAGNATAILDSSGTISAINTSNTILASVRTSDGSAPGVGQAIALDLRANTTGVVITQLSRGAGATDSTIGGDILFSNGAHNDQLLIANGIVEGLISFGGGDDLLAVDDGSIVRGALEKSGGTLSVALGDAKLDLTRPGVSVATNLHATGVSTLAFTADPAQADPAQRITRLNVANNATLAAGSKLQLHFTSKLLQDETFTVLSAGNLINEGIVTDLTGQIPALFTGEVQFGTNTIDLVARRRTAADLGLVGARARAFESFYQAFDADPSVGAQFLSKISDEDFEELYKQFLPDYSGGPFRALAGTVREGLQAQAEQPVGAQPHQPRSWLQEIGVTVKQETVDEVPYQTGGFGIIGGFERPYGDDGYLGFSAAYMSSEIRNNIRFLGSHLAASALTGGVYWRQPYAGFMVDADATAGIAWFDSVRRIVDETSAGQQVLIRQAEGKWTGLLGAARVGVLYNLQLGPWYVRPNGSIDAVFLREGGYTERGGGDSVNLTVDSRTNYESTAQLGLKVGTTFGRVYKWGPEFELGYRSILASGAGDTSAAFAATANTDFTLAGVQRAKRLLLIRAALRGQGTYSNFSVETAGEIGDNYEAYMARLVIRFVF